jgi:hypothetical protein
LDLRTKAKELVSGFAAGLASLVAGYWLLGGFASGFSKPWVSKGDVVAEYLNVTGISESGSSQIVSGFGWPFSMDKSHFLTTDWLSQGIYRALLIFVEPIAAVNLYLTLTYFLIAIVTYIAWRNLDFSRSVSVITALSLTLIPWHIQKSFWHPNLSFYVAAPLFILFIVLYLKWQSTRQKSYFFYSLLILFTISITAEYWWIFTFIFLTAFFMYRFSYFKTQNIDALIGSTILYLIMPLSAVISLLYQRSLSIYPTLGETVVRSFEQVERYSGSFTSLLLPSPLTAIPFFRTIRNNYETSSILTNHESSPWGSVIAIIAILITIYIIFSLAFGRKDSLVGTKFRIDTIENFLIKIFSMLFLVGLGFYWTSGLGSLSGLFITDWIRSWGRIYIFLVYFAMAAAMLLLKSIFSNYFQNKNLKTGALISIVALIFVDQLLNTYSSSANEASEKLKEAQEFSAELSKSIDPACPILQIPVFPYPEAGYNLNEFQDYEHFWLALADRTRSYSHGANKATQQYLWQKNLEILDLERLKLQAAAVGYCAVVVDLSAYESRVKEGNRWIEAIGAPLAVSSSARWAGWKVGEDFTNNQIRDLIALNWVGNFAAGTVQEAIQIDFYDQEFSLYALNPTKEIVNGVVSFEARSGTCTPSQAVRIVDVSDQITILETNVNKELTKISFEVSLEPREQKEFKFELASQICTVEWWSETKVAFRDQKFSLSN